MKKFKSESEYENTMEEILQLMNKGEKVLSEKERKRLSSMVLAAQKYEHEKYTVEMPKTLTGMIELKMYERRLNQEKLAKKLRMNPAKVSLIINGKQKPDIDFLKKIRKELGISADFILDHA